MTGADGVVGRVTLQTIADQVGVSRMTVSNAFSRPDQLSPALRRRILAAAEDLGYVGPDPAARALAKGATGAVGILLTDSLSYAFTDEVAIGFLGAIADELTPTGLALTLLTSSVRQESTIPARDVAMDGALIYSCESDSDAIDWLIRRRLPLVYVDEDPVPGAPSVNVDDRGGARAAAQHLVDLGHRRIDIVTTSKTDRHGPVPDPRAVRGGHVTQQRMLGWLDALDAAGITPRVVEVAHFAPDVDTEAEAFQLLDAEEPPTAILCFSDVIARGVVQAAMDRGLRVPVDLSVVGFDDSPLARRLRPALTTVRQDLQAKGRAAVSLLTAELAAASGNARAAEATRIQLPTELVVRASTAPPPER